MGYNDEYIDRNIDGKTDTNQSIKSRQTRLQVNERKSQICRLCGLLKAVTTAY